MNSSSAKSSVLYHKPETLKFHRTAIEKVILLMQADPSAELDWDILARTACISRYHFLRIFEGLTQYSPHRFLVALRMEKAKRLLLESPLNIGDVAFQVGYSSAATFIRVFKMTVGMSPSVFRRLAASVSLAELKPLLALPAVAAHAASQPGLKVSLRAPPKFKGIIFIGLFDAGFPYGALTAGAVITNAEEAQLTLPQPKYRSHLVAVGFSHPSSTDIKDYLLMDRDTYLVASAIITAEPPAAALSSVELCLQFPSLFDPPISPSLPLLLFNLVRKGTSATPETA